MYHKHQHVCMGRFLNNKCQNVKLEWAKVHNLARLLSLPTCREQDQIFTGFSNQIKSSLLYKNRPPAHGTFINSHFNINYSSIITYIKQYNTHILPTYIYISINFQKVL